MIFLLVSPVRQIKILPSLLIDRSLVAENVSDDFEISFEQIFKDLKFSKIFYVQSVHEIPNFQIKKIMKVPIIFIFFYVNIFLLKFIPRGLKLTLTDSAIFVACDARSVRD